MWCLWGGRIFEDRLLAAACGDALLGGLLWFSEGVGCWPFVFVIQLAWFCVELGSVRLAGPGGWN